MTISAPAARAFEITEHKAVYNMEECADLELPLPRV